MTACEQCGGACCESVTLEIAGQNNDFLRFLELRSIPQMTEKGTIARNFNVPCSMLRCGRCLIYDTRPQMCKDFPPGGAHCRSTVIARRTPDEAAAIFALLAPSDAEQVN